VKKNACFVQDDVSWMRVALREAAEAESSGEVPVGAVIVLDGVLIGRGHNSSISLHDPTAHAEIQALRAAAQQMKNYRLVDATAYVTVEPCLMCMGALLHARIHRVVFGCFDEKFGAAGSLYDLSCDPRLNHRIAVTAGVLEEECKEILQKFFRKKRTTVRHNGETKKREGESD
jgi:tRNA(adenine34) deaminase